MVKAIFCTSCKKKLGPGSVTFSCPNCSKQEINRCYHCRELATRYQCSKCEWEGPH
ncbi:RNA-binding protein [archaeon]|nr:RNA-binding protein [archaeon]